MQTSRKVILAIALLLLSAPCWAQMMPDGTRILYPDRSYTKENLPIVYSEMPKAVSYETKIIPEAELERYLNEGWELVKVYVVKEEENYRSGVTQMIFDMNMQKVNVRIWVNKAIIRRAKP